jgi:hypothetical protein
VFLISDLLVMRRSFAQYRVTCRHTFFAPAEPPTLTSEVSNWRPGDTIPLGRSRTLRVVGVRDDDADHAPVLVVEDAS